VQDLVLGMGFNFWGKAGMKLCGASEYLLRHKANNNEELPPPTMDAWIQCPGCSRKVASLVLMDAFCKPGAITGDTHVGAVGPAWGWADGKGEDTIAREIEGFIPIEHWRDVNTVFAGMRQLWWDDGNKEETRRIICAEALEANNWKDIKRLLDAGRKKEAVPPFWNNDRIDTVTTAASSSNSNIVVDQQLTMARAFVVQLDFEVFLVFIFWGEVTLHAANKGPGAKCQDLEIVTAFFVGDTCFIATGIAHANQVTVHRKTVGVR